MAKLTREELSRLRDEQKKKLSKRDSTGNNIEIIIGMGTCGIAAGAKEVLNTFVQELDGHSVENVLVKQTGCMGLCYAEPTVEVLMPDMPAIIYGKVDEDIARKIVRKHILGGILINDHIFDRPAVDIIKE